MPIWYLGPGGIRLIWVRFDGHRIISLWMGWLGNSKELADNARQIPLKIKSVDNLPSAACVLVLPDKTKVAFSSSHLSPFKIAQQIEPKEYRKLNEAVTKECSNCVMLGDYNMRQTEDSTFENMSDGGWEHAWKGCGANPSLKFTWDTFTK